MKTILMFSFHIMLRNEDNKIRDFSWYLTLFILIDYPIPIGTISMALSILYFKGITGQHFYKMMYFCL